MVFRTELAVRGKLLLGLIILLASAVAVLTSCGGEAVTTTGPSSTMAIPASDSGPSVSPSDAASLQAQAQEYINEGGGLGPVAAENVACMQALLGEITDSSGNVVVGPDGKISVSASLKERIQSANLATQKAYADWSNKQPPVPQLDNLHSLLLKYLQQAADYMKNMNAAAETGDPYALQQSGRGAQEAAATRQEAWNEVQRLLAQYGS
jgi:hypothetical protein